MPESEFYWLSDDSNEYRYYIIGGYKSSIDNYPVLRYPSRCHEISECVDLASDKSGARETDIVRSFTKNIKKIEQSKNIVKVSSDGFDFNNVETIELSPNLMYIGQQFFTYCKKIKRVTIPAGIIKIENGAFDGCDNLTINLKIQKDYIIGAPWGATNATINWNYTGE